MNPAQQPRKSASAKGSSPLAASLRSNASHKFRLIMHLVCREQGVSVDELVATTGWKPHAIRGFLSRISNKPLVLIIEKQKDTTVGNHHYTLPGYRILQGEDAER